MSLHLIIGDKDLSSWSLRGALALALTGAKYTEELVRLDQPDTRQKLLKYSATAKVPLLKTEFGVIADSWRLPNTWPNSSPMPVSGPRMWPLGPRRARPVHKCTAASSPSAATCPLTCCAMHRCRPCRLTSRWKSSGCWRCGQNAVPQRPKPVPTCSAA